MDLKIHRTETNTYQLQMQDVVLVEASSFAEVVHKAKDYAKKFQKNIFISQASVADWYVGFRNKNPEVFYDPHFMVKAYSEIPSDYTFVEGPFISKGQAEAAAFKISGKTAKEQR